jgi:hypothetical protein
VRPYGEQGLVHIADTPEEFVAAIEAAMGEETTERLREVDAMLSQTSWDRTWKRMTDLIEDVVTARRAVSLRQATTAKAQPALKKSATARAGASVVAKTATASYVSGD